MDISLFRDIPQLIALCALLTGRRDRRRVRRAAPEADRAGSAGAQGTPAARGRARRAAARAPSAGQRLVVILILAFYWLIRWFIACDISLWNWLHYFFMQSLYMGQQVVDKVGLT